LKTKQNTRSPLWSVRALVWISIPVVIITTLLVFYFSTRSFVTELTIALGIIAAGLFVFLAIGLYVGAQLEQPTKTAPEALDLGTVDPGLVGLPMINVPDINLDIPDIGDAGNDLVGCLVSIVVWIAISLLLMLLFWLLVQLFAIALPWILLALYWMFYRALKLVLDKAPQTRGQLGPSIGYALLYTALYTGWLFMVLGALQLIRLWTTS